MKKTIILLVLTLVLSLTGCKNNTEPEKTQSATSKVETVSEKTTEETVSATSSVEAADSVKQEKEEAVTETEEASSQAENATEEEVATGEGFDTGD